ncbi:MAG: cadmium-translocating P-type ATPase, partial [Clostridia bacterium]|nr:cadmium-translocating P-type ATPase [Clostridia bacterium]
MTRKQKRLLSRIVAGVILLIAALITEACLDGRLPLWQVLLLYLPAYLIAGLDVLKRAGQNILHGQIFDEGFLMALATLGALAVGFLPTGEPEFAEAVFVMILYKTGTLFESIAVGKSRRSVSKLMDLRPQTARVLRNGCELEVSPDAVKVNELILVRPGERIPLDGTVVSGRSDLDTSALTGESLPLAIDVGARAVSGATNLTGALTLRVTSPFEDSTVQRILSLVEGAAARKARSEQFITRFARYYTPFVVICAILVAILPPLASQSFSAAFPLWLTRALTFLVVSCPCALVISVPLTFFGSIGGAARHGILIKGGTYLEQLAKAQTVVLDKTGTLTRGSFTVSAIRPSGIDEAELLALAAAAEQHSNHPIAKAIAAARKSAPIPAKNTQEVAGRGVICEIDGRTVGVGNDLLMRELGVVPDAVREQGTAVHVAR